MTAPTTTSRFVHNGDGATKNFPYTNRIFVDADLEVYLASVLQTLTTDYTVSGAGDATGGNVTFITAPPTGTGNVVILRNVPNTQSEALPVGGPFPSTAVEKMVDRNTILSQQLASILDRTIKLALAEAGQTLNALPLKATRASQFFGWDSDGQPIAAAGTSANLGPVSAFIDTLLDDVDAAAARATLGALQNVLTIEGDLITADSGGNPVRLAIGTNQQRPESDGTKLAYQGANQSRGFIFGYKPENDSGDTDHDLSFTKGVLRDDLDAVNAGLSASPFVKQLDAAFAQGTAAGALGDTVTLPASETMHLFSITKDSDGSVDILADTSTTGTNVPAGWTVRRRVGSWDTDGSNNLRQMVVTQLTAGALLHLYKSPLLDVNVTNLGTTAVLYPLSVPADFKMMAIVNALVTKAAAQPRVYVSSPDANDEAPSDTVAPLHQFKPHTAGAIESKKLEILTDTSSQIRARSGEASTTFRVATLGWIDWRLPANTA